MIKKYFIIVILLSVSLSVFGQNITEMEFRNQPVTDILLVLAEASRQSIIPDDTVEGRATYLFHDMPFEEALTRFLENQDLYFIKRNDVYYISRISIDYDSEGELISLQTEGTDIQKIIKKISQTIGKTILFDALPREEISLHFENGKVESLLNIIIRRYADYSLESGGDYYYISRISSNRNGVNQYGGNYFTVQDNLFSADLKKVRFLDVLADLMGKGGYEYSVLGQNDSIIERFSFRDKTFSEILDLLLEQANSGYEISNGIYYFFDKDRQDILNKFVSTIRIPLIRNSADSIVSLIPDYLIGDAVIKKDPLANNIIISGPVASLVPLESYILGLENDLPGYAWNRFDLNFLESGEIASFLPETYSSHKSINLEESNAFLMYMSVDKVNALRDFLNLIDIPVKVTPVYLNYITAENLMNNLPPSIDEERVSVSSDPNLVFFRGNIVQLDHFKDSIAAMDRPIPQIRYDVLVLQVQDTNQLDWESSLSNEILSDDSQTAVTGSLGRILSLNFDIVSQFGYLFAAKLNTALDKSEARVMADTTLYALSGESIEFKNTGTSRYYEAEYNSEGELQDYGTINEISSGLIIEIEGWVSGDGMITMTVGSTISKENTVDSNSTYALPSTTEKIVSTSVRTPSGQPIIITGLKQQDTSYSISKVPFLGDIPLIGLLFQKRQEIIEDTDFYITIVPHLEYTGREAESNRYEDIFRRLVTGYDS